jgi:hypothetical protein
MARRENRQEAHILSGNALPNINQFLPICIPNINQFLPICIFTGFLTDARSRLIPAMAPYDRTP